MGVFGSHLAAQRCVDGRDGRRCQLLVGHGAPHAAMVSPAPFVRQRWDADAVWSEWESYRFGVVWEQLRWSVGVPRLEAVDGAGPTALGRPTS